MKKVLLPLMAMVLSATTYNAMASHGTVKFTGEIKRSACEVTADTQNKEVYLGTYPTSAFKNIGDKSASKGFQVSIKDCDPGDYTMRFDGNTVPGHFELLSVSAEGNEGTSAATGIGIEITDNNGNVLPVADGSNISDSVAKVNVPVGQTTAVFNFQARYRSFGVVTPGLANATSSFTIEYK